MRTGILVAVLVPALAIMIPAQRVLTLAANATPGQTFGRAVAGLGDVSGDGVPDFAVGAYNASNPAISGGGQAGRVDMFSGANGALLWSAFGTFNLMQLGIALAPMPDFDGDGRPDLLAGAPEQYPPPLPNMPLPPSSSARLLSGATGATILVFQPPSAGGGPVNDSTGSAVALAGDLTGDTIPDVVAGAPYANRVHVFSGFDASLVITVLAPVSGFFGRAVAGIGDVTGDGIPDYLVGASLTAAGGITSGAAYVFSGANHAVVRTHAGTTANESFGASVAGLGDVDLDGVQDYAVGGTGFVQNGVAVGKVSVFSGLTGVLHASATGSAAGDICGAGIAALGDLDQDGAADFAYGISGSDAGGTDAGRVVVVSGLGGVTLGAFNGLLPADRLGLGLSALPDLDQDGAREVLAGAAQTSPNNPGYAAVISFGPFLGPCAAGGVLAAGSGIESVLRVNGSDGGAAGRVDVASAAPISVDVLQPTANPFPAEFLLFGFVGLPGPADLFPVGFGVGTLCFPPSLLVPPAPHLFLLATSWPGWVPPGLLQAPPGVWSLALPVGLPGPLRVALQSVTEQAPGVLRAGNAVLVNVL